MAVTYIGEHIGYAHGAVTASQTVPANKQWRILKAYVRNTGATTVTTFDFAVEKNVGTVTGTFTNTVTNLTTSTEEYALVEGLVLDATDRLVFTTGNPELSNAAVFFYIREEDV